MLLNEFFGKSIKPLNKTHDDDRQDLHNDLFWFIVDHDKLHKDYFFPIAQKILKNKDNLDKEEIVKEFMPMVVKGCKEYYEDNKLTGVLGKVFSKELRNDLCERLFDHYQEDIISGKYKLGF